MRVSIKLAAGLVPAAIAAVLITACADGSSAPELSLAPPMRTGGAPELSRLYRLGYGDQVRVTVFGEPDLSGTFTVNATGAVTLPLVGDIVAKDRPIVEFREAVARRLSSGVLKNPNVTVEVVAYRPIYVHGEVKTGGEYPFRGGMHLQDAVAMAGGYSRRGERSYLFITREGQSTEYRVRLPNRMAVMPGDNIRVPETAF